jgi:hypothetical protein
VNRRRLAGVLLVVALGVVFGLLFTGPRMRTQVHLKPHDAAMPRPPAGAVPVTDAAPPLPSEDEAATMTNPLFTDHLPTMADHARARTYYDYYCAFCHNTNGDGEGPVGHSLVPFPADLRTARVRAYSDGQLLRAILTGSGHRVTAVQTKALAAQRSGFHDRPAQFEDSPPSVLLYTVLPEHRWYLVLHVRSLSGAPAATTRP